jgi:hypothetical protein
MLQGSNWEITLLSYVMTWKMGILFLLFFTINHCIFVNKPSKMIGETLGIRGI